MQIEMLGEPSVLILRGNKDEVNRVAELLRELRRPGPARKGDGQADEADESLRSEVRSLGELDGPTVLKTLATLLAGVPDVRMEIDQTTGKLIVFASPDTHTMIRETLKLFQRPAPKAATPDTREAQPREPDRDKQ